MKIINENTLPPIIVDMIRTVQDRKSNPNYRETIARRLGEIADITNAVVAAYEAERHQTLRRGK